ncbi:MAG: ankyrin repeat domain-containing protein, partial [Clostridia bacterium]|nr:ankyrin repeat domain-containing protein [Clostridia bacterium]
MDKSQALAELKKYAADPNLQEECRMLRDFLLGDTSAYAPVAAAAKLGSVGLCEYFLQNGADIDETDSDFFSPLMNAVKYKRKDVVDFLISRNADVTYWFPEAESSALTLAAENGDAETFFLLLKHGAPLTERFDDYGYELSFEKRDLFISALKNRCREICLYLLESGYDWGEECRNTKWLYGNDLMEVVVQKLGVKDFFDDIIQEFVGRGQIPVAALRDDLQKMISCIPYFEELRRRENRLPDLPAHHFSLNELALYGVAGLEKGREDYIHNGIISFFARCTKNIFHYIHHFDNNLFARVYKMDAPPADMSDELRLMFYAYLATFHCIHERMFTGGRKNRIKDGSFVKSLLEIDRALESLPENAVISEETLRGKKSVRGQKNIDMLPGSMEHRLLHLCRYGTVAEVEALIEAGADINARVPFTDGCTEVNVFGEVAWRRPVLA